MRVNDLFTINHEESIGTVYKVDSYSAVVHVADEEILRRINVNGFVLLHTSDINSRLIGRIDRVSRLQLDNQDNSDSLISLIENVVYINALGTLKGPGGGRNGYSFTRSVETLPEIGAKCFLLENEKLTAFTSLIAQETTAGGHPLSIGTYTLSSNADALIDGNAFFQRHAMIVGSTGSGKSWTVATIVEQVADLPNGNLILFDLHGEYSPLEEHQKIKRYKIAGPGDLDGPEENVLFLPYWLLGYEDMLALILDRSDENAPNQSMAFSNSVINSKRKRLEENGLLEELETFTIDSPVPYSLDEVYNEINELNTQMVVSASTGRPVKGPFNGKFDRFLPRLNAKKNDRRHGFLFHLGEEQLRTTYLDKLANSLIAHGSENKESIKIIDFSEVPSDILPIVISLVARLVFQIQQWSNPTNRFPITLACDEAHLYLPARQSADAAESRALTHFERIAKEGRKYGVGLLIISQRPSELNTTIMSQCNNIVALRLANNSDKQAVSNLLPENLGGIQDLLPTLGIGETIIVGDASLLPSRIRIKEPRYKPNSGTVRFWDKWSQSDITQDLSAAVQNLRRQKS